MVLVIGLMSGTSLDGVDVCCVEIGPEGLCARLPRLVAFRTYAAFAGQLREELLAVMSNEPVSVARVCRLNFALGRLFGELVVRFMREHALEKRDVAFVASHGQTLWHDVDAKTGEVTSTLQLGEASCIAEATGLPVVSDFRVADVAAGGHGAPLVSTFDCLCLRPPPRAEGWRALLNVGGIANVTLLPPQPDPESESESEEEQHPIAFDTGPGNLLIDWAVRTFTGESMDVDGRLAARGAVLDAMLDAMLAEPFFARKPPKTTGRELFSASFAQRFVDEYTTADTAVEDIVATFTELTALSVARVIRESPHRVADVLVAGGGARNAHLMARLRHHLGDGMAHVDAYAEGDEKEAVAFAVLGWLCWKQKAGNVPACTGAKGPRVLGKITHTLRH